MPMIVLLKILSDLGFYYTFVGTAAAALGSSSIAILIAMGVESICFTAAFALRNRGWMKYLPVGVMALCFLIPGADIAGIIAMAVPIGYSAWLVHDGTYIPDWSKQVSIFRFFWKVLLAGAVVALAFGFYREAAAVGAPASAITMICQVLLMRALRHDTSVYSQKKYQMMDLSIVLLLALVAAFMSTNFFLDTCSVALEYIYQYGIRLLIMGALYVVLQVVNFVVWIFSFIGHGFKAPTFKMHLNLSPATEYVGTGESTDGSSAASLVLGGLGIVVAVVLLFILFRYFIRNRGNTTSNTEIGETRFVVAEKKKKERGTGPIYRVRSQYKKFLKALRDRGITWEKSYTSLQVDNLAKGVFNEEDAEELRQIYIAARYSGRASKDEVDRAKELADRLRRSGQQKKKKGGR